MWRRRIFSITKTLKECWNNQQDVTNMQFVGLRKDLKINEALSLRAESLNQSRCHRSQENCNIHTMSELRNVCKAYFCSWAWRRFLISSVDAMTTHIISDASAEPLHGHDSNSSLKNKRNTVSKKKGSARTKPHWTRKNSYKVHTVQTKRLDKLQKAQQQLEEKKSMLLFCSRNGSISRF